MSHASRQTPMHCSYTCWLLNHQPARPRQLRVSRHINPFPFTKVQKHQARTHSYPISDHFDHRTHRYLGRRYLIWDTHHQSTSFHVAEKISSPQWLRPLPPCSSHHHHFPSSRRHCQSEELGRAIGPPKSQEQSKKNARSHGRCLVSRETETPRKPQVPENLASIGMNITWP